MPKLFPIIDALTPSWTTVWVWSLLVLIGGVWKAFRIWRDHEANTQAIASERMQAAAERYRR